MATLQSDWNLQNFYDFNIYGEPAAVFYVPASAAAPAAPSGLTGDKALLNGLTNLTLTWHDNSSNEEYFRITLTPNGGFNWTPGLNFASTTNGFTVRVTDDGVPPLSDTKSFAITVVPPPTIVSGTLANDLVTLEWTAIPGQVYRMQLKPDLTLTNWTDIPGDVTATNTLATGTNAANGAIQQFYRVLVLP